MNLDLNPKQLIDSAMSPSTDTSSATSPSRTPSLDTATIEKIEALSDHSTRLVLPTDKRTDPFK